jgi:hypothetical protein
MHPYFRERRQLLSKSRSDVDVFILCQVTQVWEDVFRYQTCVSWSYHFDFAELKGGQDRSTRNLKTYQLYQSLERDRADLWHLILQQSYHIRYDSVDHFLIWYEVRDRENRLERLDAG